MESIAKVGSALDQLFGVAVNEAAEQSGVIIRQRQFSALSLAQTFICGFLANPVATDEDLAQVAMQAGVKVTPQAIEQRYSSRMVEFLKCLYGKATKIIVGSDKALAPLLERFTSVTLLDSSTIALPDDLKEQYRGCGGSHGGGEAAMKLQVEWDLLHGALTCIQSEAGRSPDGATTRQEARRGKGSLRIADLGYFNLNVFEEMTKEGEYFLSRLQNPIVLMEPDGTAVDLTKWLPQQTGRFVDQLMLVGKGQRLSCRIIAWRLPNEQAAQRRFKLRQDYKSKYQKEPSAERLALCDWTILVTNVPFEIVNAKEAVILYRARWQIELLFKRWKSLGLVALLQGSTTERQMVKLWARLIAALVQHWLMIGTAWGDPTKSWNKVWKAIKTFAARLAVALKSSLALDQLLDELKYVVEKTCRRNKRSKPGTVELLNEVGRLEYS